MTSSRIEYIYTAEPTPVKFHASDKFYRIIIGPVRSSKSTCCSIEILRRMQEQAPGRDGVRRSRVAVIRNTYGELRDTTVKTWLMWAPQDIYGKFNYQTMTHSVKFNDVDCEVLFRALDRPQDIAKLLSMELTMAWVNEGREIPKAVVDTLGDRVCQYPSRAMGGCTWGGVILDTNPPDTDHWLYLLAEEGVYKGSVLDPEVWEFFKQPGALIEVNEKFVPNPEAENIGNLNEGIDYYLKRVSGKSKDYVKVYYCGQYGFVVDGRSVIPEYIDSLHCAKENILPVKKIPIIVGLDFGLTPAAIMMQFLPSGRWVWIDELCAEYMGSENFGRQLRNYLGVNYSGFEFDFWGDPAGNQSAQTDEKTVYQILEMVGIPAKPCDTNDFEKRRETIAKALTTLVDGKPQLMISPKCKVARKGLMGGYCYRRVLVAGDERYHDKPDKNIYSHPVEAGGYGMLGGGALELIIRNPKKLVPLASKALGYQSGYREQASGWMIA